jgi:hypothetical protein
MQEINDQLMDFQEFLMETLYSHDNVDLIQEKLKPYYTNPLVARWVQLFTPSMLEVAARMTQHWGKKAS